VCARQQHLGLEEALPHGLVLTETFRKCLEIIYDTTENLRRLAGVFIDEIFALGQTLLGIQKAFIGGRTACEDAFPLQDRFGLLGTQKL
jgi:hypothetical protein